jgi:hypothetical protein
MPHAVNVVTPCHAYDCHILTGLDFTNNLKKWNDRRPDFVPAGRHHPLFQVLSGEAKYASIIFHTEKRYPTNQVGEGNKFFRKIVV